MDFTPYHDSPRSNPRGDLLNRRISEEEFFSHW